LSLSCARYVEMFGATPARPFELALHDCVQRARQNVL
jgi:hypothetical protein